MFKKAAIALALGLVTAHANAASPTASGTFDVTVTLTPKCEIYNGSGLTTSIGNISMTYTSFQTSPSTGTTSFAVRCTNTQAYSMALDNATVTDGLTGLEYTLNLSTSGTHSATANASLSSLSGNGNTGQTYHIHSNIAAGQDGTVTAGAANNTRTLTITY